MGLNCVYVKTIYKNGVLSEKSKNKIRLRFKGVKKNYINGNAEIIFNTCTGIYYDCIEDASFSINKKKIILEW